MSKIKATQRLIVEDFPDQKDWIGKLFYIVNRFITEVVTAVNGGLLFGENVQGVDKLLDFVYVSATASFPQVFVWPQALKPTALSVVSATEDGVPVMVVLAWTFTADGLVSVTDGAKVTSNPSVTTLQVNKRYKIRIRVSP